MEIDDFKNIDRSAFTGDELMILRAACAKRREDIKNRDVIDVVPENVEEIDWNEKVQKSKSAKDLNALLKNMPEVKQIELQQQIDEKFDSFRA